jgi:hypothetical protein
MGSGLGGGAAPPQVWAAQLESLFSKNLSLVVSTYKSNVFFILQKSSQAGRCVPVVLALRRLRQEKHLSPGL